VRGWVLQLFDGREGLDDVSELIVVEVERELPDIKFYKVTAK
jgi:hypothetical protein